MDAQGESPFLSRSIALLIYSAVMVLRTKMPQEPRPAVQPIPASSDCSILCCDAMMAFCFSTKPHWYQLTNITFIRYVCALDDDEQSLLINMAATPSVSEGDSATKKDDKGKGCILEARHAIAKTLVTTNPHLLTEAQTMG